ncbi:YjbF family lipoprotein [Vibrio tubiashii]|nr:YjbF family lipoprotein [Vibrio tubiashii]
MQYTFWNPLHIMTPITRIVISTLTLILLLGCAQKTTDISDTLVEAFSGFDDVHLSKDALEKLPYASSYFRINGGPQIFMVLAFVEQNPVNKQTQLKWLSSDQAMIVTENGRVVKTLYLPDVNLAEIQQINSIRQFSQESYQWSAVYSWQPNYQFNYQATIATKRVGEEQLSSLLWNKTLTKWTEDLVFDQLKTNAQSLYWTDKNGQVFKSSQWLIPNKLLIEQEVLKPYKG